MGRVFYFYISRPSRALKSYGRADKRNTPFSQHSPQCPHTAHTPHFLLESQTIAFSTTNVCILCLKLVVHHLLFSLSTYNWQSHVIPCAPQHKLTDKSLLEHNVTIIDNSALCHLKTLRRGWTDNTLRVLAKTVDFFVSPFPYTYTLAEQRSIDIFEGAVNENWLLSSAGDERTSWLWEHARFIYLVRSEVSFQFFSIMPTWCDVISVFGMHR